MLLEGILYIMLGLGIGSVIISIYFVLLRLYYAIKEWKAGYGFWSGFKHGDIIR